MSTNEKDLLTTVEDLINTGAIGNKEKQLELFHADPEAYLRRMAAATDGLLSDIKELQERTDQTLEDYMKFYEDNSDAMNSLTDEPFLTSFLGSITAADLAAALPDLSAESARLFMTAEDPHTKLDLLSVGEYVDLFNYKLPKPEGCSINFHDYENVQINRLETHISTKDKISKKVFGNELTVPLGEEGEFEIRLSPANVKSQKTARAAVDFNRLIDDGIISEMPELKLPDRAIYNGILSEYMNGNNITTPERIFIGHSGNNPLTPDQRASIDRSLDKFRGVVTIVYETQMPDGSPYRFEAEESLLNFRRVRAMISGQVVNSAIEILSEPVLLRWATCNGNEIDRRPIKLMQIKGLQLTDENIAIREYLRDEITSMERNPKYRYVPTAKAHRIKFFSDPDRNTQGLFEKCDIIEPTKKRKASIKGKIEKILKHWQNCGLIESYKFYKDPKKSNAITAVDIVMPPRSGSKKAGK